MIKRNIKEMSARNYNWHAFDFKTVNENIWLVEMQKWHVAIFKKKTKTYLDCLTAVL